MDLDISISENFDALVLMAKNEPEAFESYRRSLIQKTIENSPQDRQTNLRRYQWRIDQEKRKHDNSLAACIKLTQMMSQRMFSINKQLCVLSEIATIDTLLMQNFKKGTVKTLEQA